MSPENPTSEQLINQIQQEEKKYQETIKDDKVFEEARLIKKRIKLLKEELVKLFPGQEYKINGGEELRN